MLRLTVLFLVSWLGISGGTYGFGMEERPIAAYVERSIKKNADKVAQLGFSSNELDSTYGIPLRSYLSVLLDDPDMRIFREESAIADFILVVKPAGKKSSKYYFDYDYGDLIPKAINYEAMGVVSGLKLVTTLPDKELTFAAIFATHYNDQLAKGVKRN